MSAHYPEASVFTVDFDLVKEEGKPIPGGEKRGPRDQSFDVAVVEFGDEGCFANKKQLEAAANWITQSRGGEFRDKGVIVVVFIHGWHHGADWEDSHFRAFRRILGALSLREMERNVSRRVIGIYVGWNGDPRRYWFRETLVLQHLSFYNRYSTARQISESSDLHCTVQTITNQTKEPFSGSTPGQLILVGHSMGGLILESALQHLMERGEMLQAGQAADNWPVKTQIAEQPIVFPDAAISLNSAADSRVWRKIESVLAEKEVRKMAHSTEVSYSPPLLISATSTADYATRIAWRLMRPFRKTTGHDKDLLTHDFVGEMGTVECKTRNGVPDFGQNFHVLRLPDPPHSKTPRMRIDLPVRDRKDVNDKPPHRRYRLDPKRSVEEDRRVWNFQLPPEIVKDHNDIFNSRSSSLILALMQISGTVGSLAPDWESSFEKY